MKKLFIFLLFTSIVAFSQNNSKINKGTLKPVLKMQQPAKVFTQPAEKLSPYHPAKVLPKQNIVKFDSILVDDTIKFKELLKRYNLFDDFVKGNWDKIDKGKFKQCLDLSQFKEKKINTSDLRKSTYLKYVKPTKPSAILEELKTTKNNPVPIDETHKDKAKLTYVLSDTMMVGKTYTVDLTLSKNMSNQQIIHIIDGFKNKSLIDTLINITPLMRARLLDPSGKNFTITPITEEKQNTTQSDLIRWQWQVIPIVEGNNSLTISVDNFISDQPQSVNIYNGKTYVFAIHTWYGDLWNWIKTNWAYITYVIGGLFAIFAWLYKEKIISIFKKKDKTGE